MFFKENKHNDSELIKICALLVHAAKIDENYTNDEKDIIKKTLINITKTKINIDNILEKAEKMEADSNQILEFTKEVKNMSHEDKIKIVETLWKIIYSNNEADIYETGLMRRLAGLLYIDNKSMGIIKEKIKNKISS